jgi:hypothetical protein
MIFAGALTGFLQRQLEVRKQLADLVQLPCVPLLSPEAFVCVKQREHRALIVAVNHGQLPISVPLPPASVTLTELNTGQALPASGTYRVAPHTTDLLLVESLDGDALEAWMKTLRPEAGDAVLTFQAVGVPPMQRGDQLFLAGSGAELGDWAPDKGLAFDGMPTATASLPADGVFEAKMVIRHQDGSLLWEEGTNRYLYDLSGSTKRCFRWSHGDCPVT